MTNQTQRIRELNDDLRHHLICGSAVITPGVAALGQEGVERLSKRSPCSTISATPMTRRTRLRVIRG